MQETVRLVSLSLIGVAGGGMGRRGGGGETRKGNMKLNRIVRGMDQNLDVWLL